jgi:hypothetical protein
MNYSYAGGAPRHRHAVRGAPIALTALGLLAACGSSDSTGPSAQATISDLQARPLQRPLDDRPVQLEIVVRVSNPERVIGGEGRLQRLQAATDTCQAPGHSTIVATVPITAANVTGDRLRLVLQPRLPAGRSRLCFLVASPDLAQQLRGHAATEMPAAQTNALDLVLDVFPARSGAGPSPPAGPPVVTITATDATAAESPLDTGTFQVSRTGSTAAPLTVSFTVGGTATPSVDYDTIGTTVTIPAGAASASITVTPKNDDLVELPETVVVTLSAGAGYSVGGANSATVTINSEDVPQSTLTIQFEGPNGTYACGSTVANNGPEDFDQTDASFHLKIVGQLANVTGVTGYRLQRDNNSTTFVAESIGSVELPATATERASAISANQFPVTYRVLVHVGHAPNHGATPIPGDVVSNECTIKLSP